jgi:hypothetical protein
MTKAKPLAVTDVTTSTLEILSFKDAAYQGAKGSETLEIVAQFIVSKCPDFLNSVPDEITEQLVSGWALRWQEKHPAVTYNDEWVPVKEKGMHNVSLAFCLSFSQQAFGQLKNDNPVKHGIIQKIRLEFQKYKSNRLSDLRRAVGKELNKDKPKVRVQAALYDKYLKDTFDEVKARCKTALARNDATAPSEVKVRMAIDAFYAALAK